MKNNSEKFVYESPVCREIGIQTNCVIAASTGERYSTPTDWTNKGDWA